MNFFALSFFFFISAAVPVGVQHSYFLWPWLPRKFRIYSSLVEHVVPSGLASGAMFYSMNPLLTDLVNSRNSSYFSIEFQLNVGAMRVVKGLGASAFSAAVSVAIGSAGSGGGMVVEIQKIY